MWRALIAGDLEGFEVERKALVSALRPAGLTLVHLASVDAEILLELLEVVVSRYGRSHRAAAPYRLALTEIARRLEPAQARAAA